MSYKFIWEIKVRPGEEDAFIRQWHNGSVPIQKMPGAKGTLLHKKREEERTYVAIPQWESKEARQAAFAELDKPDNELGKEMRKWGMNEDFGKVTPLMELDEIDTVYPPEK